MLAVGVDRGGTFTDSVSIDREGTLRFSKLLSINCAALDSSALAVEALIGSAPTPFLRFGSTIATNALLELKGEKTCLAVTKGFKDLLEIRYQNRSDLFSLDIRKVPQLYSHVVEIDERVTLTRGAVQVLARPD